MNAKEARELAESPMDAVQKAERLIVYERLGELDETVRHALALIAGEASEGRLETELPQWFGEYTSGLSGDPDYLIRRLQALGYTVARRSDVPSFAKFNQLKVSW